MLFQVFSLGSKRVFQGQEDINVVVISALLSIKLSQLFEILIFSQDIWRNVCYVPEIKHIS